jgi:lysozyme family protein
LQCSGCSQIESNQTIYYAILEKKQVYWFVVVTLGVENGLEFSFGYEEADPLSRATRKKYPNKSSLMRPAALVVTEPIGDKRG